MQLFFLFYVMPEWGVALSALTTGVLALGLHYSTYTSEVYRAGIDGVPAGQWEAATALSLPARRTGCAVILPQAFRRVVPALGNYVIAMFKDSPMLAYHRRARHARPGTASLDHLPATEPITVVGVGFILIAYPASLLPRALERRLVR